MEPLVRRTVSNRSFEDGIRWVAAIQQDRVDPRQLVSWLIGSLEHQDAFCEAWVIWHDLRKLSLEQRRRIEELASELE
jgi:ferric-dicitrate binding protein FerR (iron transport regulator)